MNDKLADIRSISQCREVYFILPMDEKMHIKSFVNTVVHCYYGTINVGVDQICNPAG